MTRAAQVYETERVVIAEGAKVVKRLLQSGVQMKSFFATERYYQQFAAEIAAKQARAELSAEHCFIAEKSLMSSIVGYKLHEGIMALAEEPTVQNLYDAARTITLPAVFLHGVVDSENVGAIVRNCVAFGIRSLITDKATSSPYLRRAVRVSLGSIFGMQVYTSYNPHEDLQELKETRGVQVVAAETHPHAIPLHDCTFPQEYILCFGSEGYGISEDIVQGADVLVEIRMKPDATATFAVNSLNVAASSAIILHHAQMQRV
jgi:tRNA G18 (ribose-2'-O)-methylase SpoU